jgi:hypothetical protein
LSREHHADDEGKIGAQIAERAGDLIPVEAKGTRRQ